jgi:hypothetical protein
MVTMCRYSKLATKAVDRTISKGLNTKAKSPSKSLLRHEPATEALERGLLASYGPTAAGADKFSFDSIFQAALAAQQQDFPTISWLDEEEDCTEETLSAKWKALSSPFTHGRMVRSYEISSNLSMLACV